MTMSESQPVKLESEGKKENICPLGPVLSLTLNAMKAKATHVDLTHIFYIDQPTTCSCKNQTVLT